MKQKTTHSPCLFMGRKHINLLDFGFKKSVKKFYEKYSKDSDSDLNFNLLVDFIEDCFNYSRMVLPLYSSCFSKKLYSHPTLFTILCLKVYLNETYHQISNFVTFNDKLKNKQRNKFFTPKPKKKKDVIKTIFNKINQQIKV